MLFLDPFFFDPESSAGMLVIYFFEIFLTGLCFLFFSTIGSFGIGLDS